ncbi:MAG: hypothetical protein AB7O73_10545, partial [Bacteroidia bacterium]
VYIINKNTGVGTMTNQDGRFNLVANEDDTLLCSYIGYTKLVLPLKSIQRNKKGDYLIFMRVPIIDLNAITVNTFKYKPYEKQYMSKIIDQSKLRTITAIESPITALYMTFSKRGREIRKLAEIYEEILIEEEVSKKINADVVRKLTGDDKLDYENFKKYCLELNNQFILTHEGFDLYNKVMDCYKRYKSEGR